MVSFMDRIDMPLGLCHYWAVDYKFKLYGVMKWCFILLSHFLVVKNFGLL